MAVPFDPTHPRHLTPQQRLDELAAILATGTARARASRPTLTPEDSAQIRLDVFAETSLHVPQLAQPERVKGVEP
jgi:hypothetical protein